MALCINSWITGYYLDTFRVQIFFPVFEVPNTEIKLQLGQWIHIILMLVRGMVRVLEMLQTLSHVRQFILGFEQAHPDL